MAHTLKYVKLSPHNWKDAHQYIFLQRRVVDFSRGFSTQKYDPKAQIFYSFREKRKNFARTHLSMLYAPRGLSLSHA